MPLSLLLGVRSRRTSECFRFRDASEFSRILPLSVLSNVPRGVLLLLSTQFSIQLLPWTILSSSPGSDGRSSGRMRFLALPRSPISQGGPSPRSFFPRPSLRLLRRGERRLVHTFSFLSVCVFSAVS